MQTEKHTEKELTALGEFIVVIDNGFVFHGDLTSDGDFYLISHAVNIRKWGTTNGLGELRNGKLSATIVDETGEVLFPKTRLCHLIRASWKR